MILVTGATGNLGLQVIDFLLQNTNAENIVALVRDENKAEVLKAKGINIRQGNYDDKDSLNLAMQNIDKVFLISGSEIEKREQQHKNVIDAAKKAGVKYIAYTSFSIRNINGSVLKGMMESHFPTEEYIKKSGLDFTIFRNNYYGDVIPLFLGDKETILNNGIIFPAGDGKVPYVLRSEMAEAFAKILLNNEDFIGKTLDISNIEAYSFDDIAQAISVLSGKEIHYNDIEENAFKNILESLQLPEFLIRASLGTAKDIKNDQNSIISTDLQNILGRKPADLKEMIKTVYDF